MPPQTIARIDSEKEKHANIPLCNLKGGQHKNKFACFIGILIEIISEYRYRVIYLCLLENKFSVLSKLRDL